jgi:non-ribosomal peptide synthetase component F
VEKFLVPDTSVSALEKLAGQERTTLFTAALAVFYLWLHRVTGEADLAVGSMFANRLHQEAVRAVGFFANLLVLRTEIPARGTFRDLLRATRGTVNGALDHQEVPFQMVRIGPSADRSVRPEDLMFQMQPWPVDEHRVLMSAEAWQIPPPEGVITRFAFEFFMCPAAAGGLLGLIAFAEERFDRSWVRQAATDFEALAAQVASAPETPLAEHG